MDANRFTPKPPKPWHKRMLKKLRFRWVQVVVVLTAGLLVSLISYRLVAPKVDGRGSTVKDKSKLKFLHCDSCKLEMQYNPELDGKRCPKCKPPKSGFLIGTERSIKDNMQSSPWRFTVLVLSLEALATLGGVVYLLYLPVVDPTTTYYVFSCPHCLQRLRFRQMALGGAGMCSRCKRAVRFPDEDEAVLEEDLIRAEQEAAEAEHGT